MRYTYWGSPRTTYSRGCRHDTERILSAELLRLTPRRHRRITTLRVHENWEALLQVLLSVRVTAAPEVARLLYRFHSIKAEFEPRLPSARKSPNYARWNTTESAK